MNNESPILSVKKAEQVLWLKINSPKSLNALTTALIGELLTHFQAAEADAEIKAVFLTGTGRAFSAGQNLQEVTAPDGPEVKSILKNFYLPLIKQMRNLPKPVICGVNGLAVGAGFSLALACDLILVAGSAKLQLGFSKIGLIPDAGATYFLVKSLGHHRSANLILNDEPLTAKQALDLGLAAKLFDDETFAESCSDFMKKFALRPTGAMIEGKKLINAAHYQDLDTQLAAETDAQDKLSKSHDYLEAVEKFLAKGSK